MKSLKIIACAALLVLFSAASLQAEEVSRHQLGDYTVICLNESSGTLDEPIVKLPAGVRRADLEKIANWNQGGMNYFVLDTGKDKFLFDAGNPGGNTVKMLAKAGIAPGEISFVFLTHMHPDHIGGLVDDSGRKVFPKAKMYIAKEEAAYWGDPAQSGEWFDLAKGVLSAYEADIILFSQNQKLQGVESIPTFGHTPGHTAYRLISQGKSLFIWGDILHIDAQFAKPDIYLTFDVNPTEAVQTRKQLMKQLAETREPIAGMHILAPAVGSLQKDGAGYRFVPGL